MKLPVQNEVINLRPPIILLMSEIGYYVARTYVVLCSYVLVTAVLDVNAATFERLCMCCFQVYS